MQAMIVGEVALVVGFLSRCGKLSPTVSHGMIKYAHKPIAKVATRSICWLVSLAGDTAASRTRHGLWLQQIWTDLVILPTVGLYLCLRWTTELFSSMLSEIVWLILMASWGLVKVIANRIANVEMQLGPDHVVLSSWSFGQIIAVALLVSPLFSIARTFFEGQQSAAVTVTGRPNQSLAHNLAPPIGPSSHVLTVVAESASESRALLDIEPRHRFGDSSSSSGPRLATDIASDVTAQRTLRHVIQTNTRAKHAIMRSLVLDGSPHKRPWVSICVALACLFWVGVACFASAMTNHNIATGDSKLWASGSPATSMTRFWLTEIGILWVILFCYPTNIALCIALAIRLEVEFGQRRKPRAIPRWVLAVLAISCIIAQGSAFTSRVFPFIPLLFARWYYLSMGSLARTVLSNILLAISFYATYFLVSFGLIVRQVITAKADKPAIQPDDARDITATPGQGGASLEYPSQN